MLVCFYGCFFYCLAISASETLADTLDVIEVTAQKRIQSVQNIPISITALSAETLESVTIHQSSEIATLIPNVNSTRSISGMSNFYIRGVGMDGFNLSSVAAVGIYVDDVAIFNPMLANFTLFDIDRVEVLKGPQNTLYGKNTTGGAINFITNRPLKDEFTSGYGQVTLGNNSQVFAKGAFSSNVSEQLSFRLAGFSHHRDGLVSSEIEGNNTEFNDIDQHGIRLQLAYQLAKNISLTGNLYGGKQRQIAEVKTPINAVSAEGLIDLDDHDLSKNHSSIINPPNDIDALGGYFKVNLQQDNYIFNGISSFENVKSKRMDDWGSQHLESSVYQSLIYNSTDTASVSQEFQWQSNSQQPLQWIAGVLYNDEKGDLLQAALIDPAGPGRPDDNIEDAGIGPMFDRGAWVEHKSQTFSAYTQFIYELKEKLNVTTGFRWTRQKLTPTVNSVGMMMDLAGQEYPLGSLGWLSLGNEDFDRFSDYLGFDRANRFIEANGGFPASAQIDERFNEWGGKFALDYRVSPNLMIYSALSRGFKMGAVNSNPTTTAYQSLLDKVVKPETLITTEIGFKTDLYNKSLRINAAVFKNLWQDYQFFLVYNPGNPADLFASLVNLPEAESLGAELDLSWKISPSLRVNLGIGWLDSEITNGNLDTTGIPEDNIAGFQSQVITGNTLTNTPKWSYSVFAAKNYQLNHSDIELSFHYAYFGKHNHQLAGSNSEIWINNFSESSTAILTVNALWIFGNNREYQLAFWAKNLTDEQYCSERSVAPGASPEITRLCAQGESRSLGLTGRIRF
ncbi:TonB-dependent receptor [uncultured Paraglaciecola sp.]|uniref:TonB-dependent receptor n=1 Tax=uncultured Paraglaciecola sp. TaxID=1765024 RepID=UPI0030DDAF74|tara:strand:- start:95585 stop:97960 length:2376 start_codon:yes stop_codon:yes gene_type:complete